jgi:hypothetical protein
MVDRIDPVRDEIARELGVFRKGAGKPGVHRIAPLFYLTEALGDGNPDEAMEELSRYQRELGQDPMSNIGAFFYLSGWGVGLDTIDARRARYLEEHYAGDISTPWRRSGRGIAELAAVIRDQSESHRPWAFVSLFQSGTTYQPVLDFNMSRESWQPAQVFIDGVQIDLDFHFHADTEDATRLTRRFVLPESPLRTDVGFGEAMAAIRVRWPMPVWPTWSLFTWTADSRIMTHMRVFRGRAVEASIQWWHGTPAGQTGDLARDRSNWAPPPHGY